jgi:hypothetical protein
MPHVLRRDAARVTLKVLGDSRIISAEFIAGVCLSSSRSPHLDRFVPARRVRRRGVTFGNV